MPELVMFSTRPWYTMTAVSYPLDPPPRYVVSGVEYEGLWGRNRPTRLRVSEVPVRVEAYREHWHPIARWFRRRVSFPKAVKDFDVPRCERVIVEFRASALWSRPGRVRVREIVGTRPDERS